MCLLLCIQLIHTPVTLHTCAFFFLLVIPVPLPLLNSYVLSFPHSFAGVCSFTLSLFLFFCAAYFPFIRHSLSCQYFDSLSLLLRLLLLLFLPLSLSLTHTPISQVWYEKMRKLCILEMTQKEAGSRKEEVMKALCTHTKHLPARLIRPRGTTPGPSHEHTFKPASFPTVLEGKGGTLTI